jgi:hypothetical protein
MTKHTMQDPNLDIEHEFDSMLNRLKNNEYFAFSRFNDGEVQTLMNIDFTCKQWQLTGNETVAFRQALAQSLCYQHPDYIVGIPCSCREDIDGFRKHLMENYPLHNTRKTFGALFVNAMHKRLQNEFIPAMTKYPIILVANEKVNLTHFKKCGFDVKHFVPISHNAWQNFETITKSVQRYTESNNPKKHLFLFSAGPVANILIPAIHKTHPENTYIDIGSCIDRQLGLPEGARNYLKTSGWKKLAHCIWHHPTRKNQISCSSYSKTKWQRMLLRLSAIASL